MKTKSTQNNIPDGWLHVTLSSIVPSDRKYGIVDGPFGSNLKTIHYQTQGIPIITSGYVTEGRFLANEYLYVTPEKYEKEKRSAVKGGDIVMAKIGARCGASAIMPHDHPNGILSGNALKITVDERRYVPKLIWHMLWRLYQTGKIAALRTVGAQPAISIASLKIFKLTIPPLPEQKRIVGVLEVWDSYLAKLARKIEIKKQIKKGLMRQLLTGKRRLKGFSEPWKPIPLKKVGHFFKGEGISKAELVENGFKAVRYGELYTRHHIKIKQIFSFIAKETTENAVRLKNGDIAFAGSGETIDEIGKSAVYLDNDDCYVGGDVIVLRVNAQNDAMFLAFCLNSLAARKELRKMGQGQSVVHIYKKDLEKLTLGVPALKEQRAIADILTKADDEIEAMEKKKKIIEAQKKYLLNNLITGTIRTPENLLDRDCRASSKLAMTGKGKNNGCN